MKFLNTLLVYFLFVFTSLGQTWLQPPPTTKYPANQSIQYITTNLFFNSFFLGGTNGTSGYFIWNGTRIDSPADLAVAVSNSVAPSNFLYKIDFEVAYSNLLSSDASLSNLISVETANRVAGDAAISNQLLFVPTNAVVQYFNSLTNFLSWTNNGKTWFFNVCLTNGQGAGGFGGTNIINITNTVIAGTTYVSNFFNIAFNLTNNNNVILNTSITNIQGNIIITNLQGNVIVTNNNNATFNTSITNLQGDIYVSNHIDIAGIYVTNIILDIVTNNISISNHVDAVTVNNTNFFEASVTNYVTITNLIEQTITNTIIVYATNIIENLNITNETALTLSNTFNTVVSNTSSVVVTNNITIQNITQSYTNIIGGMTNVFIAIDSSSNYIAWVSNSVDGFISYNEFCVTNGSANWSTGNFANVFSDYVYNFAQNNQYSISGIVVSVMDAGVQTQATRYITYNEPTSFDFENHAGYGWQVQTTSGLFVRVNALATNIPIGATVALTSGVYKIWNAIHSSTDTIWRLNSQLPNTNLWFDVLYVNVSEITQSKLQLTQQTTTTNWPSFGLIKPIATIYTPNTPSRGHFDDEILVPAYFISGNDYIPPFYTTNFGLSYNQFPNSAQISTYGQNYYRSRNKSYWIFAYPQAASTVYYTTNTFTNIIALSSIGTIRMKGFACNDDGKIVYITRSDVSAGIYKYTNFPIDTPVIITNAGSRLWYGVATFDGTNVMASTSAGDVWMSFNGGTTWISNNVGGATYDAVTLDGQRWWIGRNNGIYYSDNFGTNWTISPFLAGNTIVSLYGVSNFLYGQVYLSSLTFYSTNSGTSFNFTPTSPDSSLAFAYNQFLRGVGASKVDNMVGAVDANGSITRRNNLNDVWTYWWSMSGYGFNSFGIPDIAFDPYSNMVVVYGGGTAPTAGGAYFGYQLPVPLISTNRLSFSPMQILFENIGAVSFASNKIAITHLINPPSFYNPMFLGGVNFPYLFWVDRTNMNYCYSEGLPRLQSVFVEGTNIFTSSGILLFQGTTSSSNTWEPISHNSQTGPFTHFEIHSNNLYIATSIIQPGQPQGPILIIPLNTNDNFIKYTTTRATAGWSYLAPVGISRSYTGFSVDDIQQSNWWSTVYQGGLLQSTNFGATWITNTAVPALSNWMSVDALNGTILAAYYNQVGGLRRSTNNGASFDIIRTTATTYLSVDMWNTNIAYYTDGSGIYSTTDLQSTNPTWSLRYNVGTPYRAHRPRTGPHTNTIYWADSSVAYGGLWKTTNDFATVERQAPQLNTGLNTPVTYGAMELSINPANNNEILMTTGVSEPALISTNQGASWSTTGVNFLHAIDTIDGNILWASTALSSTGNKLNWPNAGLLEYFMYSTDFGRSWSAYNTTNANFLYRIRDFGIGYGNKFIVNQHGNILDSLTGPPEMLTNSTTTVTTKSASRLDSSTWKNIYDSVATYNNVFNYIQFSFNNEASYVVYNNGQWNTTVTNNAGTWQYWNGSSWVGAVNTNTPKNNVLSQAVLNGPWKMTVADLGNVGNAAWEYNNGFNTNTTTNINVAISLLTTNGINPPNLSSIAFSVYDGFPSYRKSDSNYLIEQSTNNFQRLTRQATGTTDAIIHYMRNP